MNDKTVVPSDPEFGGRLPAGGLTGPRGHSAPARAAKAREDASGITGSRQRSALEIVDASGPLGLTWQEVGQALKLHHGQATGVLSKLHEAGYVTRLATVKRGESSVYVTIPNVAGRAVAKYAGRKSKGALNLSGAEIDLIEQFAARARAQADDKPFLIKASTAKALADVLDRLSGQVRG